MWLLFVIKALVLACDENCSLSCQIMNAQESCFKACDCEESITKVFIPEKLIEEGVYNARSVAIKISCDYGAFEACGELQCPYKYVQCIQEAKCENLIDFKFIVENIPSYLWVTVQPKILVNTLDDGKGKDLAKDFRMCVEYCYEETLSIFKVEDEEFYRTFRGCSKEFCAGGLDDERVKCDGKCEEECVGDENVMCKNVCLEKQCMVYSMSRFEGDICDNQCYNSCYLNGEEEWSCYLQCIYYECSDDVIQIEKKPFKDACQDECYSQCYLNGEEDLDCYNACINNDCETIADNKFYETEDLIILGGVSNCGQVCFQQCFVNYQMISGCYNNCMNTCISVANSEFLVYALKNSPQECAQACTTMKGLFDKECYNECINGDDSQNDVECEWKCYSESLQDEVFDQERYENCIQRDC